MAKAAPNIASGRSFHNVSAGKWTSFSQLALAFNEPGVGHNQPPDVIDPIEGLKARIIETHSDLPARFRDPHIQRRRLPAIRFPEIFDSRPILFQSFRCVIRRPVVHNVHGCPWNGTGRPGNDFRNGGGGLIGGDNDRDSAISAPRHWAKRSPRERRGSP